MKATFVKSEKVARNIVTFWFEPQKKPKYIAGQFIELQLPHKNIDNRSDKRWFTLSSSPTEEYISITTKFVDENGSTFKNALRQLQPGDKVSISMPMGDFVLPKDTALPLIFIAGGIGCTPFRSMTKYIKDNSETRDIQMIYAAKSIDQVAFQELFKTLPGFTTSIGERISAESILKNVANAVDKYFYLSGPEPMIEALVEDLKNAGIHKKHIHTDYFPNYTNF